MKIMHVFISMPVGGAEDLVMSFLRAKDERMQPEAVCLREPGVVGDEARAAGLPIHVQPVARRKQFNPFGMIRFSRWLREQNVDVVHSHVYNSHQYAVPAARLAGIPCVIHHHKTFNPRRKRRWFILRLLARMAVRHLTLSDQTRKDLVARLRFPDERVVSLPNSVDTTVFKPTADRQALKRELGLPTDRLVIGGIASLAPQKNHGASIEMFRGLKETTDGFHGIICGEGPLRVELEAQIGRVGLTQHVFLPGNKRPLHPWLQAMDLLVFPSTWEGQPMVLLQAMACETPIIASDIEGNVATLGADHPGLFAVDSPKKFLSQVNLFQSDGGFADRILAHQRERFASEPSLNDYLERLHEVYAGVCRAR